MLRLVPVVAAATLMSLPFGCDVLPDDHRTLDAERASPSADARVPSLDGHGDADGGAAPGGCARDDDCARLDGCCLRGACANGTCQVRAKADCCTALGPCAALSPLHTAECVATCTVGGCEKALRLDDGTCGDTLFTLEMSAEGLTSLAIDDRRDDRVTWHLSERRGLAGGPALYAGDVLCPTYYNGPLDQACAPLADPDLADAVYLAFTTPFTTLPADAPAVAELWLWMALPPAPRDGAPPDASFDGVDVVAVGPGGRSLGRWTSRGATAPRGQWFPILVDLSELAGQAAAIRVAFDTVDGRDNHFEGVYVGGLSIRLPCPDARDCPAAAPCALPQRVPIAPTADALCLAAPPEPSAPCQACDDAADCATADPCDVAACNGGACAIERVLTPECCDPLADFPHAPSFEDPLTEAWTQRIDDGASPTSAWHVSDRRSRTGARALRFGDRHAPRLAPPGEVAAATIWSPPLDVPRDAARWRFSVWLSTEWDAAPSPDNPLGVDLLEARVVLADEDVAGDAGVTPPPATPWDSRAIGGTTGGAWLPVEIDLAPFAGRRVRVGWRFQTGDAHANDHEGVYIDDTVVERSCPDCPRGDDACHERPPLTQEAARHRAEGTASTSARDPGPAPTSE